MSHRKDIAIIGGGIIGCWSALHFLKAGCSVVILDRQEIGAGASGGNCGFICPSHVHPLCGPGAIANGIRTMAKFGGALSIAPRWDPALWSWLLRFAKHCNQRDFQSASIARHALLQSSRKAYQQFAETHTESIDWHEQGLLLVYRSKRDFDGYGSKVSQLQDQFGMSIDRYDGNRLSELEPCLRDDLAGGWHFPSDAHLSPSAVLQQLRLEIESRGGQILERTEICEFDIQAKKVVAAVTSAGQRIDADQFVLTTGAESASLGIQLGMKIPVVPGKGYSVTIQPDGGLKDPSPNVPMIFEDDHVALTPLNHSLRIGSTMQLTGFSRTIPKPRIELLKSAARRHLKSPLPVGEETHWTQWRPMMPDGLPCIDRSPEVNNVLVAAGNGMIGMATGPATGQLITEIALGHTTHIDPAPYRLNRFT